MTDPNDFVNQDETEGDEVGNPHAGQEGSGGLTTNEAEESYQQAAEQHFKTDIEEKKKKEKKEKQKGEDESKKKNPHRLPQIGSIEDDEITVDD